MCMVPASFRKLVLANSVMLILKIYLSGRSKMITKVRTCWHLYCVCTHLPYVSDERISRE